MKFEFNRLSEYSDDAILTEIRRVAELVGTGKLTIAEFSVHSKVGISTLRRRFGSWPRALELAGLAHLYNLPAPVSKSSVIARSMTNDEILNEIRRVSQLVGQNQLTADDLRRHAIVGVDAIRNRFGTLKLALHSAGILEVPHGRRYTDEECFENLLIVWMHYGRTPKYDEMNVSPSYVGPKAYIVRWRTWNHALQAFVDRVNQETEDSSEFQVRQPPEGQAIQIKSKVPEEDLQNIKLGLRYYILDRDKFKCVLCGASPAIDPSCCLHVDHIIPWSKGGKTVKENLRTLCKACNLGKGNRFDY